GKGPQLAEVDRPVHGEELAVLDRLQLCSSWSGGKVGVDPAMDLEPVPPVAQLTPVRYRGFGLLASDVPDVTQRRHDRDTASGGVSRRGEQQVLEEQPLGKAQVVRLEELAAEELAAGRGVTQLGRTGQHSFEHF